MPIEPVTHLEKTIAGTVEPITHLEKSIAGTVEPVTHLEKIIDQYGGGGQPPSGTISITENGTYDVAAYAEAEVEVASEDNLAKLVSNTLTSLNDNNITSIRKNAFNGATELLSISAPNALSIGSGAIGDTPKLQSVFFPKVKSVANNSFEGSGVPVIALPSIEGFNSSYTFRNNTALTTADFGPNITQIGASQIFSGDINFATLILRRGTGIVSLTNINNFNGTKFASGGSGGTIYIPKALYDHLGDGTALDYKAATNWSTIDGYGTITWAQIEGSQYENAYADGTPIS